MPFGQCPRLGFDDHVLSEAGMMQTHLRTLGVEDDPETRTGAAQRREVEADHHASWRQAVEREVPMHPCVQHHAQVEVLRRELDPALTPRAHRRHDVGEVVTRLARPIDETAAVGVRCRLDHADALELPESFRQDRARDARRPFGDLGERRGAVQQVPQDDRGPTLGEDLRRPRDRASIGRRSAYPECRSHRHAALVHFSSFTRRLEGLTMAASDRGGGQHGRREEGHAGERAVPRR